MKHISIFGGENLNEFDQTNLGNPQQTSFSI